MNSIKNYNSNTNKNLSFDGNEKENNKNLANIQANTAYSTAPHPLDRYSIYSKTIQDGDKTLTIEKFGIELEAEAADYKSKLANTCWIPFTEKCFYSKEDKTSSSVVYKITNKKVRNVLGKHKFYIGKTKNSLDERVKQHFVSALKNERGGCPRLKDAVRRHGMRSLRVKVLYNGPDIAAQEHRLIKEMRATDEKIGYNIRP